MSVPFLTGCPYHPLHASENNEEKELERMFRSGDREGGCKHSDGTLWQWHFVLTATVGVSIVPSFSHRWDPGKQAVVKGCCERGSHCRQ